MSDTRPYPKILRTTVDADRDLRAYAAEYEIKPFEALVVAIDRLKDPVESETLRASLDKATATIESLTAAHDALLAEIERIRAREMVRMGELAAERKTAADLRADLESAREATRRADAEVAKLGALKSAEIAPVIERFKSAFGADIPQAPSGRAAPQPCACACALPAELDQRVRKRIAARPSRDLAFIVKNGCDRLEASDGYQDRQKAAKRAARSS